MRSKYTHTTSTSEYEIDEATGAVRVPLRSRKYPGMVALVDHADLESVAGYVWRPVKIGRVFYAHTSVPDQNPSTVYMHRIVLGLSAGDPPVDHINHDGLDNRRANIRTCQHRQNMHHNRPYIGSKSRFKGLTWCVNRKKWRVRMQNGDTVFELGVYASEEFAARVYDAFAVALRGEYAYRNFPDDPIDRDAYQSGLSQLRRRHIA